MKKNGFVLLETIIVISVLSIGLIYLYSSYAVILNNSLDESFYNKPNDIYLAYYVNDSIKVVNNTSDTAFEEISYTSSGYKINACSLNNTSRQCTEITYMSDISNTDLNNLKIKNIYFFHRKLSDVIKDGINYFDGSTIKYLKSLDGLIDVDKDYLIIKTEYNGHYYFAYYITGLASYLKPDYVSHTFELLNPVIVKENNQYKLSSYTLKDDGNVFNGERTYDIKLSPDNKAYVINFTVNCDGKPYNFTRTVNNIIPSKIDRLEISSQPNMRYDDNGNLICSGGSYKIYYDDGTSNLGNKSFNCSADGNIVTYTVTESNYDGTTIIISSVALFSKPTLEIIGTPIATDITKSLNVNDIKIKYNGNTIDGSKCERSITPVAGTDYFSVNVSCYGLSAESKLYIYNAFSNTNIYYNYTGNIQSFIPAYAGKYRIDIAGAKGGDGYCGGSGGRGGVVGGETTLSAGATYYIVVGGQGEKGAYGISGNGGYNGGGDITTYNQYRTPCSRSYINYTPGGSGGGATHIATRSGLLSTLSNYTNDVLMVAGGGGGGYCYMNSSYNGGAGGGNTGGNAGYSNTCIPQGGSQKGGGICSGHSGCSGGFGKGGYGCGGDEFNCSAGGGSGWYGGAGRYDNANSGSGGGGGSSYIKSNTFSNTTNNQGTNNGNGYASITFVSF